jgi:transposase
MQHVPPMPPERMPAPADRRRLAASLFATGATRAQVARLLGVSRTTAGQWYRRFIEGGGQRLCEERRRGRPPSIDADVLPRALRWLAGPPRAAGYDLDAWSLCAIAALLERETGITYHHRHVPRVLRRMGWVLPPVGPTAAHAFRQVAHRDPEGNLFFLRQRAGP